MAAGHEIPVAPILLEENELAWEIWLMVSDQVVVAGKRMLLNLAAVVPVISQYGLIGEGFLWELKKVKIIHDTFYRNGK